MKNLFIVSATVAAFALAGCAKEEKMMKDDDAMMEKEATMEKDAMMEKEAMAADATASENPMMDLCFEKGGSIGEWAGADGPTQTCDLADGSSYPLASLTSFEAFQ